MYFDKSDITVCGNVATAPTLRFTKTNQTPVTNFRVAISQGRDQNTQEMRDAEFISIVLFGDQARRVNEDFQVGDRIIAVGNLRLRPFEREDGSPGLAVEIWAQDAGVSNKWDHVALFRDRKGSTGQPSSAETESLEDEVEAALGDLDTSAPETAPVTAGGHTNEPDADPESVEEPY